MNRTLQQELEMDWAGLAVFERLSKEGAELSSEEVRAILGTRSVKGIGSALAPTRSTLSAAGIRFDETVSKRSVRGRTHWSAGPRIRQAMHVLKQVRSNRSGSGQQDSVPVESVQPDYLGPVLVLRALKSEGNVFRFDGGMPELDVVLEYGWGDLGKDSYELLGEVFIHRIEPGADGFDHPVPTGYGENGIWVRGVHDYPQPRVAGSIGSGRFPTMIACICRATWVERRIALVDASRQVDAINAECGGLPSRNLISQWNDVEQQTCYQYANWIGARGLLGPRSAPPLRMRLRCWYEIVIETSARKRVILREEGLRGDDERTTTRAIARWRETSAKAGELILNHDIRIAKRQPRPMPK